MAITPLPTAPSRARPATFSAEADALLGALPTMVLEFNASMAGDSAAGLAANLAGTGTGQGSALVGVSSASRYFAGATVEGALQQIGQWHDGEAVNVFEHLTFAEYLGVIAYNYATDVSAKVQTAIDTAFAAKRHLHCPSGGYLVSGLTLPGTLTPTDTRARSFRIYGDGIGIPYATLNNGGTVFKSTAAAPILTDPVVTLPNALAEYEVDHIRFDGSSSTPVVHLHALYGNSSVHHNVVYQRGVGDGFKFDYIVTGEVKNNYAFNRDFVTTTLGASRVGIGFNFTQGYGGGLPAVHHNSARGFLTGYSFTGSGGGSADNYSPEVHHNEASTVYNGFVLSSEINKAWVHHNYLEGGDQGIGIKNDSDYASIENNLIFPGFSKCIEDITTTNVATLIQGNLTHTGSVANAIGIDVASSAAFGGNNKSVVFNAILYTLGTAGVSGLKISGTDPRITHHGNMYSPRGGWTGSGTKEINDQSTNGVAGFAETFVGARQAPMVSRGVVYLQQGASALTESNVATNALTVPEGNYHTITPGSAVSINKIIGNVTPGRLFILRLTNNQATFTNSVYLKLPGGTSFTGGTAGGMLVGIVDRLGADNYFYVHSAVTHI